MKLAAAALLSGFAQALVAGTLAQEVAATEGPAWIAYAIVGVPGEWGSCWRQGIEEPPQLSPVRLEGSDIHIYVKVEARRVTQVRRFRAGCEVDAGGLPVKWMKGVTVTESVAFLVGEHAADAIGLHPGPEATAALEGFVAAGQPEKARRTAAFWLGATRGQRGVDVLVRLLREDPSDKFREHVVYALSRSKEGIPVLLDAVRRADGDRKVRQKAMYWLARSEDPRARQFVDEVLAR